MPQVTMGGRIVHYEDVGSGEPALLLHGFPFTGESFWPQLAAPPLGCRLIVPDHRGFGRSSAGLGPSTMEALADDALQLLGLLGLTRAVVGGVSMGGYVAMAMARLDPSAVKALALIDTQALADDEAGKARREQTARDVEATGVGGLVDGMLPRLLAPGASEAVRHRLEAMMRRASPAAVAAAARGMALRTDSRDVLSRFAGPCLVVVGDGDVITPPDRARELAALVPGAQLEIIAGAGHLPNLEQPEAFATCFGAFVRRVAG